MFSSTPHSAVSFEGVSKCYKLRSRQGSARESLSRLTERLSGYNLPHREINNFYALQDLSFSVGRGEALGLIGPNGSGKTTALKLLTQITSPTSGTIRITGRLSALIELGAGFHPELTGRENVYLNGAILGMPRRDIERRLDQIVAFAEIEAFMDTPVKRYSSGMYARLGFAVAAHVEPDILAVDEVLSVGDMAFQAKCFDRMAQLLQNGTTLIFVSHNFEAVRRVCSRVLVLYHGRLAYQGPADDAVARYSNILRQAAIENPKNSPSKPGEGALAQRWMSQQARIERVELLDADGHPVEVAPAGSLIRVAMTVAFQEHAPSPVFACTVRTPDGGVVYDTTTRWQGQRTPDFSAGSRASVEFSLHLNLLDGSYQIGVDVAYQDLSQYYDRLERGLDFVVKGSAAARGVADLEAKISVEQVGHAILK